MCLFRFLIHEGVNPLNIAEVVGETVAEIVFMERSSYVKKYKKSDEFDFCKCIDS